MKRSLSSLLVGEDKVWESNSIFSTPTSRGGGGGALLSPSLLVKSSPVSEQLLRIDKERLETSLELNRHKHERQVKALESRIEELEQDRSFLYESEKEVRAQGEHAKREAEEKLQKLQGELTREKNVRQEGEERCRMIEQEKRKLKLDLEFAQDKLKGMDEGHQSRMDALKTELAVCKQILSERDKMIVELNEKNFVVREGGVGVGGGGGEDDRRMMEADKESWLERIDRLERTNRRLHHENEVLRESSSTFKILEERLHTAECKVEQYKQLENQYHQIVIRDKIEGQQQSEAFQVGETKSLFEKTLELANIKTALGEKEAKCVVMDQELKDLQSATTKLQTSLKTISGERDTMVRQLAIAQGQESLLRSELDLARQQLQAAQQLELATQQMLHKLADGRKRSSFT